MESGVVGDTELSIRCLDLFNVLQAYNNCSISGDADFASRHRSTIVDFLGEALPRGSGIAEEWHFELEHERIRAYNAYKCLDEHGKHEEWLPFVVTIHPEFQYTVSFRGSTSRYVHQVHTHLDEVIGGVFSQIHATIWAYRLITYHSEILSEVMKQCGFHVEALN